MEQDHREFQTVILAAFLHDIGKLLGRGSFKMIEKGQHPQFSSDFVGAFHNAFAQICDADLLRELVQKHHQNRQAFPPELLVENIADNHTRSLATLVSLADNLSSSERGVASDSYQDYRNTPLCSVVERLGRQAEPRLRMRFHAQPLPATSSDSSGDSLFPAEFDEYESQEMNKLIQSFGAHFSELVGKYTSNIEFSSFVNHLSNLVHVHTWCVPSNTQEAIPDVSLFDHLKTTAAIAACLFQYHQQAGTLNERSISREASPRFLIMAGDMSGIQKYIFDIVSSAAGGVARRLRVRSLFVQLCSEVAAHAILRRLRLPFWNIIMNSGGGFYLLLPNTDKAKEAVEEVQNSTARWFIDNLNGELALNLAWYAFGNEGFAPGSGSGQGFGQVIYEVRAGLAKQKLNRLGSVIRGVDGWDENSFVMPVSFEGRAVCDVCHKFPAETETMGANLCTGCRRESEIGSMLPGAKYVCFFDDTTAGQIPIFDCSVSIGSRPVTGKEPYLVMKLNDTDLMDTAEHPSVFKYLATHVPESDGRTRTFSEIASKSTGQELLGFLKADVDRLGEMLVFGLKGDENSVDTISRMSTVSRLLDTFFSGWLETLAGSKYQDCYTVFAGGDDLFFVGPWGQVISLAEQIRADFLRFTGNPRLSISAGIVIAKPDYPIARAAALVDGALEQSKLAGRDRITLLDRTVTWAEWLDVRKEWDHIRPTATSSSLVPSAFLYNLLAFAEMWRQYRDGNTIGLRYHPLLAYNVRRNLDARRTPELYEWTQRLLRWPPGKQEQMLLDNLDLIMTLCLYGR